MSFSWVHPSLEMDLLSWGKGVYARREIAFNTVVIVFGGYVMTLDEEKGLPLPLRDFAHQLSEFLVIGPKNHDEVGLSDFVNHSCSPTCGFDGQIVLKSMRDINAGDPITFDYGMCAYGSAENRLIYEFNCYCGEMNCRKKISSDDWSNKELQRRYDGWMQPFLKEIVSKSQ